MPSTRYHAYRLRAEDWQGLIDWLKENDIAHRDEIPAIAQSDMEPDPRNEGDTPPLPRAVRLYIKECTPAAPPDYVVKYRIKAMQR